MATRKRQQAQNNKAAHVRATASRDEAHARKAANTHPRIVALAVTTAFMPWFVPFTVHAQAQPPAPNTTPTLQLASPAGSGYVHPAQGAYLQVDQYANRASYAGTIQLGSAAHMNVVQPNSGAVALFKDTSGQTSQIWGRVTANGNLFFTNSAGVLFGRTASVEVGSLLATTLPINEQDFLDNKNQIRLGSASASGKVENYGRIVTANGYTALVGPQVINDGLILAHAGTVALTAADRVSLDLIGDGLISINVEQAAMNASIVNSGTIEANGGQVLLTARSANALLDTVINSTGVIRANSLVERNGEIVLDGGGAGVVLASGTLEAAGKDAGTTGGTVKVLGQYVGLMGEAKVDVSGNTGGGTALIGGNFQGKGPEQNALRTYVGSDATLNADAIAAGDGGRVIVWANETTRYYGSISAKGGSAGGNGGFAEVSGKQNLGFYGLVDLSAVTGQSGMLLLDPEVLHIVNVGGSLDLALATNNSIAFADGGASESVSVTQINTTGLLTSITLNAGQIDFDNSLSIAMGADNSIAFNADATTAGGGNNSITNAGGNAFDITTSGTGTINFTTAGSGVVDLTNITLNTEQGVVINAGGAATLGGVSGTGTGSLSVNAGGAITQGSGSLSIAGASTFGAGTSDITLTAATNNFSSISATGANINVVDTNALTATATASGTLTLDAGGVLSTGGALSGTDVSLVGDGGISLGHNVTATGTLGLTSTNNAINQTAGTITATGATTASAGTGNITLSQSTNDFSSLSLSGGAIDVEDANDLTVSSLASGTNQAVSLIAGGTLTLPATAIDTGTADLTLASNGGTLTTAATLAGTNVSLTGSGGLSIGHDITAGGTLGLTSTNNAIDQTAGTITATGAATASAGTGAISLGSATNDFSSISATGGNINVVDANALTASATASGTLTLDASGVLSTGGALSGTDVSLVGDGGISLGHNVTATGTLGLTSTNNAINQTAGTITATGATTVSAGPGAISLGSAANDFSSISATGGNINVVDANALTASATASGTLTLDASGVLSTGGALSGTDVSLVGDGGISLGHNVTATGTLALTSTNNAINQTAGTISTTGATTASAGTGNITLSQSTNNFSALNLSGGAIDVEDANSMTVSALASGTNQAVSLVAGGTLTLPATAINTGTADLALASNGGALSTAAALSGNNLSLTASGGLNLAHNVTAGGALTLGTTNTAINQTSGAVAVTGTTNASAGAAAITLAQGGNDFGGAVTLSNSGANAAQLTDANNVILAASTVGGNLIVTANAGGGQITLSGGNYNTTNNGQFNMVGNTLLGGNTTVSTGGGNTNWGGTINGGFSLTVNDSGTNNFMAAIGNSTALANITTDAPGLSVLSGNVTVTGAINFLDATTANGITMTSTGGGGVTVNGANAASPGFVNTLGDVTFQGTQVGTAGTPLVFIVTPDSLTFTQQVVGFFSGPSLPGSMVFPNGSSITFNNASIAQSFLQQQATSAASNASQSVTAAVAEEANKTFGTDSVAEDVEYGFAGEVGTTPPMDHRIDESGISVPRCVQESREGVPCK